MSGDLELSELHRGGPAYVSGFAVTDQMLMVVGGTTQQGPLVMVSSDAREFEPREVPRRLGLRAVLAVGDALWVCGEYGMLERTRDHGESWDAIATGTEGCLYSLALGGDGAIWVCGDDGYAGRVLGEQVVRVDVGTGVRLSRVVSVRDEVVFLGFDGKLRRWAEGKGSEIATGATMPLTGLCLTKGGGWVVIGDGGFIGRSPDGVWFSRVSSGTEVDLEGLAAAADGRLIVVGDRGCVLVSADEGRTWRTEPNQLGLVHLWCVKRFGGGVLIGGDGGAVWKLAPPGDATWAERTNVFGGERPLDPAFSVGPERFLEEGLAAYLAAQESRADDEEDEDGENDEEEEEDDDDDDDDEEDSDDSDDDSDDDAEGDADVFSTLGREGTAEDFADIYGVPLPVEAARFFALVAGRDAWGTFRELRLDTPLRPDVGDRNLFELLILRDQAAYLGTDLVEAFCGVFGIGSQGNGDTYHLEIHPWDEQRPRQVLHFDHEAHAFSGVFGDSLDSLVYLAALVKAHDQRRVSDGRFAAGMRALYGKVAPTWHFSVDELDPDFQTYEPERRDTEFFFFRSRWITALLKNDGVTEMRQVAELFNADFNQVVPVEQLPARYEACGKYIPTALYAMWRAYLFDEPELATYLEIGRAHAARLVRDAAKLIDQLCGGREQLGTITDVRGWLAAFRALDLDPRRAGPRAHEAEAKAAEDAARAERVEDELDGTPEAAWVDRAWDWLDDGVAHRALLRKLDAGPAAAQIARIDELDALTEAERASALPQLARELSPALEAILVGSIARNDRLDGVLARHAAGEPEPEDAEPGDAEPGDDDGAPGWDAIDAALEPLYGAADPLHWAVRVPYALGGEDPLHGISAYKRTDPVPHWHFVTYGFTDLFGKESDDPEVSGFGFELTFRLARAEAEQQPPIWALNFLQNLARYVFRSGNRFAVGHKMGLNGPIALDVATQITAVCFAEDPELGEIASVHGHAELLQVVGITDDEYRLIQDWSTHGLLEILQARLPLLVTDLARPSVLADPEVAVEVAHRVAAQGSAEDLSFAGDVAFSTDDGRVRLELGALYATVLPRAMRGRIRHGRDYTLRGSSTQLTLVPASQVGYSVDEHGLTLQITQELAREIEAQLREALAGTYDFEAWPTLEVVITPSFIRGQDGTATEVRGVADPERARRMLAEENARAGGGGDDSSDEEEPAPAPARAAAALALTERALRLVPGDTDVQFTHAMLLIDAHRLEELTTRLPRFAPAVRLNVATRMGRSAHERFGEVADLALAAQRADFADVAKELFGELGEALVEHAPDRLVALAPLVPDDVDLLAELAYKAIEAKIGDAAMALYDRVLALPIPTDDGRRQNYLRAMNNACVQAHAQKAFAAAAKIADRAQPYAHENPHIYHAAACAYAASGDYAKALEQVRLAIQHDYEHVERVEVDDDLGPLLEWPEFKAMFRDWHARQEGN